MELNRRISPKTGKANALHELNKIGELIKRLADVDVLSWLEAARPPDADEAYRAATVIADRLCGSLADPIIRNAQERRQFAAIQAWLEERGYVQVQASAFRDFRNMRNGSFAFHVNAQVSLENRRTIVNMPVDVAVMPKNPGKNETPLLVECKSAGDFTNTNKRRKEEAVKMTQLRATYGAEVRFILFLCGYFDSGYLGYEAAEGLDWVWEHRMDDLERFGL